MTTSDLILTIKLAFQSREMPKGSLLSMEGDARNLEARDVEAYICKYKDVIDRSNCALIAYNYMNPAAGLWMLPKYMISIISKFKNDDFIIDLLFGALASGMEGASFSAQVDIGMRMQQIAQPQERHAVCSFLRWLRDAVAEPGLDATSAAAIKLWCDSSSAGKA